MTRKFTLKDIFNPRGAIRQMADEIKKRITIFLADNQDMLVIIADPKSDSIVVGYKDQIAAYRLVHQSTGGSVGAVTDMLQYKKGDGDSTSQFLLVIDGAIHNISKTIQEQLKGEQPK